MARENFIIKHWGGATLRIRSEGGPSDNVELEAATDEGLKRAAERAINDRFYGVEPCPGFNWQPTKSGPGWFTTDNDYRGS